MSGIYDFSLIQRELEKMTLKKIGSLMTMKQLFELTGKNLRIITYNDTKKKSIIIDHISHPDLPCMTALRMSCNIPLLFNKFKYLGDYYLDGFFGENFPLHIVEEGHYALGLCVKPSETKIYNDDDTVLNCINNIFSRTIFNVRDAEKYKDKTKYEIVEINIDEMGQINIIQDINTPGILDLFSCGYKNCETHLKPLTE
jgi:predicted patatin/cPLA2 family phospholipase